MIHAAPYIDEELCPECGHPIAADRRAFAHRIRMRMMTLPFWQFAPYPGKWFVNKASVEQLLKEEEEEGL